MTTPGTTCTGSEAALHDLLFAGLDDVAHARLNEHLLECEACRALERRLLALRDGVRGEAVAPGDGLRERIRLALGRTRPARVPLWRRPVPAYAAVGGMLVCVALAGVLARPRPAPPAAPAAAEMGAPTVDMPGGGVAFRLAEASETRVRGAADSIALHAGLRRDGASRGDTL